MLQKDKNLHLANEFVHENAGKVIPEFRHQYHLMGEVGWINDPNGFSWFKNQYHLFYQYNPYASQWGPMHWGHAVSDDLISWKHLPIALAPATDKARGGAFSGTAVVYNEKHYLMYTESQPGEQVQKVAFSEDGIKYSLLSNEPVLTIDDIPHSNEYKRADFRDPKIWVKDNTIYCIVTVGNKKKWRNQLVLFKSSNFKDWEFVSIFARGKRRMGTMWECPDLFSLDQKDVLIVSPQYIPAQGLKFSNVFSSIYMTGTINWSKGIFEKSGYDEIDSGFDFYAPQTMSDPSGRRIMTAWMNMWRRSYPTSQMKHNWAGAMILPRELKWIDGHLFQQPVKEIKKYRRNEVVIKTILSGQQSFNSISGQTCELIIDIDMKGAGFFEIKAFKGRKQETRISYKKKSRTLILNRRKSGYKVRRWSLSEPGGIRKTEVQLRNNKLKLHLFLDRSSIEILINDGIKTMSATVYPDVDSRGFEFMSDAPVGLEIKKWDIERNP